MKYSKKITCVLVLLGLLSAGVAQAASVTNGGFESPNVTETYLANGSTSVTGWTVFFAPGAVGSYISHQDNASYGSYGAVASEGSQFLELSGVTGRGGGVYTDFATDTGTNYSVLFDIGAFFIRGQGSYGNVTVDLWLNGTKAKSFTNTLSLSTAGSDWETQSFNFAATGKSTRLSFSSSLNTDSSNLGVGLDNVRVAQVSAVPEPEIYAMMLAGLGLIGSIARRRKAKQTA